MSNYPPLERRPETGTGEPRNSETLLEVLAQGTETEGFIVTTPRRIEVIIPATGIHAFSSAIRGRCGFEHLSAISCVDWIADGEFELVYHFWSYRDNHLVSAKAKIPRTNAHAPTISDQWQPALFFERDIHEMFGVVFDGNPDLSKYILTDWDGPPPMRKDFVTRKFANDHFRFRKYNPAWDDRIKDGYYGERAEEDNRV